MNEEFNNNNNVGTTPVEPTTEPVVEETAPVAPQPAAPVQVTPPIIERKTNGFAIAGLVFSLIGSGILGLILSIVGLVKVKTTYSGKGMSIAGIIISIIKLLLVVLFFSSIVALVGGGFGMVKECGKATNCVLQADGTYECTKIDDNGVKLTLSCPAEYVNESAKKNDPNKGMIPDDEAQPKTETGIDEKRDQEKEENKEEELDETIIHPNEVKPVPFNSNNI